MADFAVVTSPCPRPLNGRQQIAELTRLVDAPYLNSFGSTETGLPPASAALLAPARCRRT
jgi:hypothetical protein